MTPPDSGNLPEVDLNISVQNIRLKSRKLSIKWTQEAAQDLKDMFDAGEEITRTPLERLVEHIDDPKYDPNDPDAELKAERRRRDKRILDRVAKEMTDEVDREILEALADNASMDLSKDQTITIADTISNAIKRARRRGLTPDLHDHIMSALREKKGKSTQGDILYNGTKFGP